MISTNFQHITEIDGEDKFIRDMLFHDKDLKKELDINHNILNHSVICYTKKFWNNFKYYDENAIGKEDLLLWQRALNSGAKVHIIDKILCYYRLSANQTGRVNPV